MLDWVLAHATAANIGAVSGGLSALAWVGSSLTSVDAYRELGYLDGGSMRAFKSIQRQARLNSAAAALSAIAAGCGAYVLWWAKP